MKIEFTLLRTQVARRMLALFLLCALVPIVTLAALTYPIFVHRLETGRTQQLRDDSKGAGMLILARFERLAGILQWNLLGQASVDSADDSAPFATVAVERANGDLTVQRGSPVALPRLSPAQDARVATGHPVLVVSRAEGEPGAFLVVADGSSHDGYPRHWGYFTIASMISSLELVRDGINVCVDDAAGVLACNGTLGSDSSTAAELTARWPIFLKSEFGAPAWTIVVAQRREDALAPLIEFRRTFGLGLVFALVLVFVLSHVQIRRRMTPLADLEAGTRRLRDGDFSTRVAIESGDEFQSLGAAFNRMAADLERQFTTLSALHTIDHAALQDHSAAAIAVAALNGAPELLRADAVAIATAGPIDAGAWRLDMVTRLHVGARLADVTLTAEDIARLASCGGQMHVIGDAAWPAYSLPLFDYGCRAVTVFPIRGQREPIGALIVGFTATAPVDRGFEATGRQLAEQLALGLSNVSLLEELDSMSLGALTALARTIDASSHWTAGHSERVTQYAVGIGTALEFDVDQITRLRQGSLLHDIGKIGVPTAILDKAGPLSEAELAVMQSHPAIGARIVESVRAFRDLVPLVLHHHELLDGSGYPAGLSGDGISDIVRVLTVADVFDALTSDRPYRAGLSTDAALEILERDRGAKFDARAVSALRELVATDAAFDRRGQPAILTVRDELMLVGLDSERAA